MTATGGGATANMIMRGKSVEPADTRNRPHYISRRQMRARSAGPMSNRSSRLLHQYAPDDLIDGEQDPSSNRALINQHVNPYQEFPSMRRSGGFSLEGMPIMEKDEELMGSGEGDAFAYYFWAIAIFFFTLALLNFIVLLVIAYVLEISPRGMAAIEFLPAGESVKFLKDLIAPLITIGSGLISGYAGEPLNLVADNGDLVFTVQGYTNEPQIRVSPHEISLTNIDSFQVMDPETGQIYFDAFAPQFDITDPIESLQATEVETNRLVSPINEDLFIKSDAKLDLVGAEGISAEAKNIKFEAGQDITLTSNTGSIHFNGQVNLDPLALPVGGGGYLSEIAQYKLCICGSSGKIFAVPVISKLKDFKAASGLACLHALDTTTNEHPCHQK